MATGVTNSISCEFGDGSADDVIEIVSAEEYDSQRAKLRASLSWLSSKAYGNQVPRDLKDPFYENSQGQLMLRPNLVNLLSSSELYCIVCGKIFPDTHTQWRGHWSIIQVLSRKGIYIADVMDTAVTESVLVQTSPFRLIGMLLFGVSMSVLGNSTKGIYIADVMDTAVTESVLVQTSPFRLKAHLALMDALMRAYLSEVASVENVVKAVRRFATFNASSDLPSNPEEALEFWVNKVCLTLGTNGPSEEGSGGGGGGVQVIEGETNQKVRIVAKSSSSSSPRDQQQTSGGVSVPPMEDLMRDVGDGCAIAAVISYYRPNQLSVADICLKSEIGIADSLYNLRQVGNFCKSHLPWSSFHLSYEDFLYTHATMKVNIYTFVADLFYVFEIYTPPAVVNNMNAVPAAGRKSGQSFPSVPISNVTKKSFQKLPLEETASNLGLTQQRSPAASGHQPLLARRAAATSGYAGVSSEHHHHHQQQQQQGGYPTSRRGRRVQSLSTPQERDGIRHSVIAWQDDQRLSARTSEEGSLLANVSIDSTMDHSLDIEFEPGLSLELTGLDSPSPRVPNQSVLEDKNHPDFMQLESVHSNHPSTRRGGTASTTSSTTTPISTPNTLSSSVTNNGLHHQKQLQQSEDNGVEPLMPAVLRQNKEKMMSKAEERGDRAVKKRSVSSPQSPAGGGSAKDGSASSSWSDEMCVTPLADASSSQQGPQSPTKRHEAFVIGGSSDFDSPRLGGPSSSHLSPLPSARSDTHSVAESYIIPDRPQTAIDAVRAGIPIVSDLDGEREITTMRSPARGGNSNPSREGSVASSGDYSDHESLKIHQDHKNRESALPPSHEINQPSDRTPPKQQGEGDYHQHQHPQRQGEGGKLSLIITDQGGGSGDTKPAANTTTFAELKRLKDLKGMGPDQVDNNGLVYMQTGVYWDADGQPGGTTTSARPASQQQQQQQQQQHQGQHRDGGKSAVSFQSAPQTSWQQHQQQQTNNNGSSSCTNGDVDGGGGGGGGDNAGVGVGGGGGGGGGGSELQQLRLKLEEKRKEIERKKHRKEAQQNKMRQRLGKAAFMRVVSKNMDGNEQPATDSQGNVSSQMVGVEPSNPTHHAQLQARLGHPTTGPRLPLSSTMSTLPSGTSAVASSSFPPSSSSSSSAAVPTSQQQQLYLRGQGSGDSIGGQQQTAPRLTDWSSQSQLARENRERNQQQQQQQQSSQQQQQERDRNGGALYNNTNSPFANTAMNTSTTSPSQQKNPAAPPSSKTFSREGIQQTIDNIKNKWFKNDDSDLLSTSHHEMDDDDGDAVDGDSYSHHYQHQQQQHHPHHRQNYNTLPTHHQQQQHHQNPHNQQLPHSSHTTPRSKSVARMDDSPHPHPHPHPSSQYTSSNSSTLPPQQSQFDMPAVSAAASYYNSNNDVNNTDPSSSSSSSYPMRNPVNRASSAPPPVNIPAARSRSSSSSSSSQGQVQGHHPHHHHHPSEQDTSFEQLSCSLTDLQEEIMHMSLQNEGGGVASTIQPGGGGVSGFNRDVVGMSDALAMIRGGDGGGVVGGAPKPSQSQTRPIHGIPNQAPYVHRSLTPRQPGEQQQQPMVMGGDNGNNITNVPYHLHNHPHQQQQNAMTISGHDGNYSSGSGGINSSHPQPFVLSDTTAAAAAADSPLTIIHQESNTSAVDPVDTGFFIAFGDDTQPRRPKPKLTDRSHMESPKNNNVNVNVTAATPPPPAAAAMAGDSSSASSTASSSLAPSSSSHTAGVAGLDVVDRAVARDRSESPHIGFVVSDPTDPQDKGGDSEMQKKKIKLLEIQRKRKEDQERKRQEKETEMARKQEEKMMKQEEEERKKADDKAKRDKIFQQYLQKKNEDEEGPPPVKTRPQRRSGSKPRPKSMFVKAKPMTSSEPGAYGGGGGRDSNSSSQEDLAGRHGSPSLMSTMRSSYHFRAPEGKISMRKSVSCNQLPQNGSGGSGASTYRRPPSPDLYRIRQQRQRGNSQDSGSDAGSGSNPGSDYAGPKLFVKPSAKSNRHIIVNAISHCCLAGTVNTDTKNKVLQEMSKCDANHFLILFRDASCKYRGLFILYPETEEAFKVHGIGPKHITNDMCEKFYKYNSGGKSFNEIVSTKHLSVSVDAVVLLGSVWKTGKAAAVRR